MAAVPVSTGGVQFWMRQDLAYTVRMKHVQPYLSALNKCHEHVGLDGVALGKDVVATRKAIAHQQAAVMEETTRVRLPAEHAETVLLAALNLQVDPAVPQTLRLLRGSVAMLVDFCAGSRGNTGVHLREGDVQLLQDGQGGHLVRLRSLKGQILVDELSGDEKVIQYPPEAVEGLVPLLQKWMHWRRVLGLLGSGTKRDSWYRLPGETGTARWNVSQMNVFMAETLQALDIVAPDSFSFSWHSLRHGAASSEKAINVADSKIMWMHNWKSMQVAYRLAGGSYDAALWSKMSPRRRLRRAPRRDQGRLALAPSRWSIRRTARIRRRIPGLLTRVPDGARLGGAGWTAAYRGRRPSDARRPRRKPRRRSTRPRSRPRSGWRRSPRN